MTVLRYIWRGVLYLSFFILVAAAVAFLIGDQLGFAVKPTVQTIDKVPFSAPPLDVPAADTTYARLHPPAVTNPTPIRNVIMIIGDGMGVGQLTAALDLAAGTGYRPVLPQMPVAGLVRTYTADNLVTDSGAGATAFATGYKTVNRRLSKTATGQSVRTLLEQMRDEGKATGIVTTSYLIDATPAAFAAHVDHRGETDAVTTQMLNAGITVLFGGDGGTFPENRLRDATRNGYTLVRSLEELAAVPDSVRVLGLWDEREGFESYGPPLPDLVPRALSQLDRDPDGFFLLIEQEQTDGAGHANRLDLMQEGVLEVDRALRTVLDFAAADGQTLVLVTADHDTGGIGIVQGYYQNGEAEIRWNTFSHTSDWVPLLAAGPGAAAFTGVMDNTDIPRRLATLMGWANFPALSAEAMP